MVNLILKNTAWLMFAEIVSKGLFFLFTIFIARFLGNEEFGKYSFAFSFVMLFMIVADFGLSILTVREVAKDKKLVKKFVDNVAVVKLILGIITFILIFATTQFMGKTQEVRLLAYLLGFYVIINSFNEFFWAVFRAFERMIYEAMAKIFEKIILVIFGFFFLWRGYGLTTLGWIFVSAAFITFLITLFLIRKKFVKFGFDLNLNFWKNILREAWPFALSAIFVIIYFRINTVLLSLIKGDEVVGWFNAAYNIVFALSFIPNLVMASIFPKLSQSYKESKIKIARIYKKSLFLMSVITFFIFPALFILSKYIITLAYGNQYYNSILIFKILLLGLFFSYFSYVFMFTLSSINKQRFYTLSCGIGVPVNIILNLVLIPKFSYVGASLATVVTEFVGLFLLVIFTEKLLRKETIG